jgi:hypothetical protein
VIELDSPEVRRKIDRVVRGVLLRRVPFPQEASGLSLILRGTGERFGAEVVIVPRGEIAEALGKAKATDDRGMREAYEAALRELDDPGNRQRVPVVIETVDTFMLAFFEGRLS